MSTSRLKVLSGGAETDSTGGGRPMARLGELLSETGKITPLRLRQCLETQRGMAVRLGELLCADSGLEPRDILAALQRQWGTGTVDLAAEPADPDLVARFGLGRCMASRLLPWRRVGCATVIAAVYPDRFEEMRAELEASFGPVIMVLVIDEDFQRGLARLLPEVLNQRAESRVDGQSSCRNWSGRDFAAGVTLTGMGTLAALALAPVLVLLVLTGLALLLLCLMTAFKLTAALCSAPRPVSTPLVSGAQVIRLTTEAADRLPVVSLLVPVFREDAIASRLVSRLSALDYPSVLLDVCLVAEADDTLTLEALARADLPRTMRVVVVPPGSVRTKPRALNYALDFCRGDIVGVYDAEDAPDPDQLRKVVRRFARASPDLACLQGRLCFYNSGQNLLSRCFAIEYATWFSVILPGVARLGMAVPLGGTTLFFRRRVLEELGAWDAHNVTEDADLGLRLARAGYRTELIDTSTGEEANCRLWPWVRQRSRWTKGYAMTYATHMRRPGQLLRDLGWRGMFGVQVMFLGALAQAVLAPLLWLWWLVPLGLGHPLQPVLPGWAILGCSALLLIAEVISLGIGVLAVRRTGQPRLLPWVVLMNPYHMLATLAALKALAEMLRRPFFWDKTAHGLATGRDSGAVAAAA